jgi:hypothetical protein
MRRRGSMNEQIVQLRRLTAVFAMSLTVEAMAIYTAITVF